ncbi:MAG: AraC family transcriptional regulator, partial [Fibrobacterota bacterium]
NPRKSVTEIALDCGFGGSVSFARLFKEAYGMSASD